ncbi:MAG: glycosyltransferase [Clostridiales bacterium]|nr:glycosyltransferase [Clostridiales bacterium]
MGKVARKITASPLQPLAYIVYDFVCKTEYLFFDILYAVKGAKKPDKEEIELVKNNVTFMFKSFERQKMAKRLYKNIQSYYPGVKVIIADDSSEPLKIWGGEGNGNLEIIQLPFNSGLSYGLNRALEKVKTPFLMRMDDDELLTRRAKIGEQLKYLQEHREVDLAAFCRLTAIFCRNPDKTAEKEYNQFSMADAIRPLIIPHLTKLDETHIVMGKTLNCFLARTDSIRKIGWDDNIRMWDHHDFFFRAAGILVSVLAKGTALFHYHNFFDRNYQKFRHDVSGDQIYIMSKRIKERQDFLNQQKN